MKRRADRALHCATCAKVLYKYWPELKTEDDRKRKREELVTSPSSQAAWNADVEFEESCPRRRRRAALDDDDEVGDLETQAYQDKSRELFEETTKGVFFPTALYNTIAKETISTK